MKSYNLEAFERIARQLNDGYLDINIEYDPDEMAIIEEAFDLFTVHIGLTEKEIANDR